MPAKAPLAVPVKWWHCDIPEWWACLSQQAIIEKVIDAFLIQQGHYPTLVIVPEAFRRTAAAMYRKDDSIVIRCHRERNDPVCLPTMFFFR